MNPELIRRGYRSWMGEPVKFLIAVMCEWGSRFEYIVPPSDKTTLSDFKKIDGVRSSIRTDHYAMFKIQTIGVLATPTSTRTLKARSRYVLIKGEQVDGDPWPLEFTGLGYVERVSHQYIRSSSNLPRQLPAHVVYRHYSGSWAESEELSKEIDNVRFIDRALRKRRISQS